MERTTLCLVLVVAALIEMGCYDLNEADCLGSTELLLAALEGREEVVKNTARTKRG